MLNNLKKDNLKFQSAWAVKIDAAGQIKWRLQHANPYNFKTARPSCR